MNIAPSQKTPLSLPSGGQDDACKEPFAEEWVTITKQEQIALVQQANYWKAQYAQLKEKFRKLEESNQHKDAKIKDLQNRLFGKKSEKPPTAKSEKSESSTDSPRKRGRQRGSPAHGRTPRPHLPVVDEVVDLSEQEKRCPHCGLEHQPRPGLTQTTEIIEVEVKAHKRRIIRPAYERHPNCTCPDVPTIITAPPPPRLIPRSDYGVSFWVEALLSKFEYAQPTHRHLQNLKHRGLPVSPGTVAGGLKTIAPLFEPIVAALYQKQMTETLFHNDETRWLVFVETEGKVGYRWYLWMTRSDSVVIFELDPSRSTAVPGAHFAGLQNGQAIIVCDRYSAYKKLARLSDGMIILAFCWAHARRDFLDAGRAYEALEPWMLDWKERIATLYHHNRLRLAQWDGEHPIEQQSEAFKTQHQQVEAILEGMHEEAERLSTEDDESLDEETRSLPSAARKQQRKVCQSLLNHWQGLTVFLENPRVPLDNNLGENTIRGPVTGRKNYYGSGSLWSAKLAAFLFSILKTLGLWGINPHHWMTAYCTDCAENGGRVPDDLSPYLPWEMSEARLNKLSRPPPVRHPSFDSAPEPP